MTKEEERKKRIKRLRDQFKYSSDQLVKNEGEWGSNRLARIKENKAIQDAVKAYDRKGSKKREQGSKYEAQSAAGTAKSAADRERHMKLVLGDDWKPSDEGYKAQRKILDKMDKRNRALDPENDPGFLSALRNKTGIMPTAAENERRIMARNNARRERERLSEGEVGGALAGSAAERIREARKAREAAEKDKDFQRKRHEDYQKFRSGRGALEVAQEPTTGGLEDLGTEALRESVNKDARVKDYKGFTDEAALLGRERAMRGESPITDSTSGSLDDVGKDAMRHLRGKEAEAETEKRILGEGIRAQDFLTEAQQQKYGVERKSQLPPSIRAELDDPERGGESLDPLGERLAGKRIHETSPHLGTSIEEKAGGYRIPFTDKMKEEQEGKRLDLNDPENRDLLRKIAPEKAASLDQGDIDKQMTEGMAQDEVERAVNEEFTGGPMNQEEAQQAIRDSSPEEQKFISEEIAKRKGHGDEWVESKEATGNYVSYEGSGLVINMASLQKDINRNRNMEMLKHIPAANRPAMLVEWGYIDKGDLSTMQKQSAKELKELSLLDLKIAKTTAEIEKNKAKLNPQDKTAYDAAHKGMLDAAGKGNYELAETYRNQIHKLQPLSDTSSYGDMFEKMMEKNKRVTPAKIFKAAGLKSGEPYYASKGAITKLVDGLKTSKDSSTSMTSFLGQTVTEGENKGTTYGQLLKNHGIYSWDDISAGIAAGSPPPGIPEEFLKDEETYMNWALPNIKNNLLTQIWGKVHTDVSQLNAVEFKKQRDELAQNVTTYDEDSSDLTPDQVRQEATQKKAEQKVKAKKYKKAVTAKKFQDEIKADRKLKRKGNRMVPMSMAEKKTAYMKEGTKRLDELVKGTTIKGKKRPLSGHPKFDSTEDAIKYYKENPKKLKEMSLAFRHFISQK